MDTDPYQCHNLLSSQLEPDSNSQISTITNPINIPSFPTTSPTTLKFPIEVELRGKSITELSPTNSLDRTTSNYYQHRSTPTKNQYPNHLSYQLEPDSQSQISTIINPINNPSFPTTSSTALKCPVEVELRGKSNIGLSHPNSLDRTTSNYHEHIPISTKDSASLSNSSLLNVSGNDPLSTATNLEPIPQECLKQHNSDESKLTKEKTKYIQNIPRVLPLFSIFKYTNKTNTQDN